MITWTPEAERVIYGYLNEVSRLAAARGEDGEELHASLLEHIRTDLSERGWDLVTEDQARQLVAQLGAPGDVVGEPAATPLAAPSVPEAKAAPAKSRRGCCIGAAALILVALAIPVLGFAGLIGMFTARRVPHTGATVHIQSPEEALVDAFTAIVQAQERFKAAKAVDRDGDGVGDYGTLEELNAWLEDETGGQVPFHAHPYEFTLWVVYGDATTAPGYRLTATSLNTHITNQYYVDETRVLRWTRDGVTVPDANAPALRMLPPEDARKVYQEV